MNFSLIYALVFLYRLVVAEVGWFWVVMFLSCISAVLLLTSIDVYFHNGLLGSRVILFFPFVFLFADNCLSFSVQ